MMISCNDCRQRLGEMFEESGEGGAAAAEVKAHLAGCEKCRADLALVTAAREEMRAFPTLAAPADLRARIRRELESAPENGALKNAAPGAVFAEAFIGAKTTGATNTATNTPTGAGAPTVAGPAPESNADLNFPKPAHSFPAPTKLPHEIEMTSERAQRRNFGSFFSNPTNVTWMSCAAILLFYFASLSLPRSNNSPVEEAPEQTIANVDQAKEPADSIPDQKVFTAPNGSLKPGSAPRPGAKLPPIPSRIPALPPSALPADKPQPSSGAPAVAAKPYPQKPSADILEGIEFGSPSTPAATTSPAPAVSVPANPAPRAPRVAQAPRKPQTSNAGPQAKLRAPEDSSQRFATRSAPSSAAGASRPNGPSGPAGPSAAITAPSQRMMTAEADESNRDLAGARTKAADNDNRRRNISTRISSPRNLGWAQVIVNLPDGVRFSDGSRARVVWRGTAQANEPIDVDFDVLAASGAQEIRVTLQEVKKQDAQTVAYKTVPVG